MSKEQFIEDESNQKKLESYSELFEKVLYLEARLEALVEAVNNNTRRL